MTMPLSDRERNQLSPADREFFDTAWEALSPDQEIEVRTLAMLVRAIVRHDTAGLRTEVEGWPQLLDAADARQRELIDAAKDLRAMADEMRGSLANVVAGMGQLRTDFDTSMTESRTDRAELRKGQGQLERRVEHNERRLTRHVITLALIAVVVFGLLLDWISRQAPLW